MEDSSTIPLMQKPVSLMEAGPNGNNLAAAAASRHPVDSLQRVQQKHAGGHDLDFVRRVYGSGLAMRLATEQRIAAQQDCAAPLASSRLYGDIVKGQDDQLNFSDFLSLPQHRPDMKERNPHSVMEHQLGMF